MSTKEISVWSKEKNTTLGNPQNDKHLPTNAHAFRTFESSCVAGVPEETGYSPNSGCQVQSQLWLSREDTSHNLLKAFYNCFLFNVRKRFLSSRRVASCWKILLNKRNTFVLKVFVRLNNGKYFLHVFLLSLYHVWLFPFIAFVFCLVGVFLIS